MEGLRMIRAHRLAALAAAVLTPATLAAALTAASPAHAQGPETRVLAPFSSLPPGPISEDAAWKAQPVRGVAPNRAAVVDEPAGRVLRIDSHDSASAWSHAVPAGYAGATELSWRWRADGFPPGEPGDKARDDFAARVYVVFDYPLEKVPLAQRLAIRVARALYGPDVPAAALVYLLHPGPAGEDPIDSPYTSRARMIVARPAAQAGAWYAERRDLRADFQRAFGREYGPGMPPLKAIVVGADSDQTGARFRAWFGDVVLR